MDDPKEPRDALRRDPLRIAFCHYTADVCGGSDRSLFDLVTHLPRSRFEPAMILRLGDPMAAKYTAADIQVIAVHLIAPRRAPGRFLASYWPSVFGVMTAIRRLRADAVHVNTLNNLVGPVAARLAGRPLVWHVREIGADSFVTRVQLRLVALLATRAVAISKAVVDTLQSCGDRLSLIPNGIDLAEYESLPDAAATRAALGLKTDQPLVTTVGRLEPWKGQHIVVEAIPAVIKAHPKARFLFVGGPASNKPEYARSLEVRCRELGIAPCATFTGIRSDVPAILGASDVLVLPSVTPEPFGRTIVEAMAARCPVVATAAGGPLDTVLDGETGWLIPPNDPETLAARVSALLDDPDLRHSMGERGRCRALEAFSLDRLVRDMSSVLEEATAQRRR